MGISNLKKFIRDNYKHIIHPLNLSYFSSEKISIDISSFIYKYKASLQDKWLSGFVNLICNLREKNVHGVFVFDGKSPPEKEIEKNRRKNQKKKNQDTVESLNFELDKFLKDGTISEGLREINDKLESKSRRLLINKNEDDSINLDNIREYIDKKKKQIIDITNDDINCLKELFDSLGITYIQAEGEAEALCSYLCHIKETRAVFTEDTDVLAYGVEYYVYGLKNNEAECIILSELLDETKFNNEEFLDYCILCGTDFNDNIKGIGSKKAFELIEKYRNIENNIKYRNDFHIDYKTTREIFKTFGRLNLSKKYKVPYWESNIKIENIEKFLNKYNMKFLLQQVEDAWKNPSFEIK